MPPVEQACFMQRYIEILQYYTSQEWILKLKQRSPFLFKHSYFAALGSESMVLYQGLTTGEKIYSLRLSGPHSSGLRMFFWQPVKGFPNSVLDSLVQIENENTVNEDWF